MTAAPIDSNSLPAGPSSDTGDTDHISFFDRVLREGRTLDDLLLDGNLTSTIQKLLGLSAAGLGAHMALVGWAAQVGELPGMLGQGTPVLWLPAAYILGFMLAIAVCLPSFYFYTLLSGLDASFRLITAQALRIQARTSVVLLGCAPIYTAAALGAYLGIDFGLSLGSVVTLGLTGPFVIGFFGVVALYRSFKRLRHRLPITHERRGNIILRLVVCWGAVFLATAPVAVWRVAEWLVG